MPSDNVLAPPTHSSLLNMLRDAVVAAHQKVPKIEERALGRAHSERSGAFVHALAEALRGFYAAAGPSVRVFHRPPSEKELQAQDKLDGREFLFDVFVAEMAWHSPRKHEGDERRIPFVRRPLLQVESEFAQRLSEFLVDASKLVCGAAPLSLLIAPAAQGPTSPEKDSYLCALAELGPAFDGRDLLCALVPHPKDWGEFPGTVANRIALFQYQPGGRWAEVKAE